MSVRRKKQEAKGQRDVYPAKLFAGQAGDDMGVRGQLAVASLLFSDHLVQSESRQRREKEREDRGDRGDRGHKGEKEEEKR